MQVVCRGICSTFLPNIDLFASLPYWNIPFARIAIHSTSDWLSQKMNKQIQLNMYLPKECTDVTFATIILPRLS